MTLFRDERGAWSSMRILLYVTFTQFVAMIWASAAGVEFAAAAWVGISALLNILAVGCFGPRIAQYLGPQLGTMAQAVSSAIQKRRQNGETEVTA